MALGLGPRRQGLPDAMPVLHCSASLPASQPACLPACLLGTQFYQTLLLGGAAGARRSCAPGPTLYPWSRLPPAATAVSWLCGRFVAGRLAAWLYRLPARLPAAAGGVCSRGVMPAAACLPATAPHRACLSHRCSHPCTSPVPPARPPVPPACRCLEAVHRRHAHHCHSGRHPGHLQGLWQGEVPHAPAPARLLLVPAARLPAVSWRRLDDVSQGMRGRPASPLSPPDANIHLFLFLYSIHPLCLPVCLQVVQITLIRDQASGEPKGAAHIWFQRRREADLAGESAPAQQPLWAGVGCHTLDGWLCRRPAQVAASVASAAARLTGHRHRLPECILCAAHLQSSASMAAPPLSKASPRRCW
jgi:hypothetical protein